MQQLYKKTKFGEIPEEWNLEIIKNTSEKLVVGFVGICNPFYTDNNGIPMIRTTNVKEGQLDLSNLKYVTREFHEKNKKSQLKENDLIVARHGENGKACLVKGLKEANCLSVVIIRPKSSFFIPEYFEFAFNSFIVRNQITKRTAGGVQTVVNTSEVGKTLIPVPPLKEQQKIASILSNVDELIQKIEQIIEQTQRLKKGLMQILLTKGIGHTKFKKENFGISFLNYNIPAEWKLVKIRDIASVHGRIGWKGLKREEYTESGPLMLSVWSLIDDYPYGIDYSVGVNRLSSFRYDESPEIKLKNGDVLLAKDGDIGRIGYVQSLPEPSTVNSHVVVVRTKNNEIKSEFLYWVMNSHIFQTYCKSFTSGTTVPLLSQSNIKDAIIPIPSLNEQIIISSILYSFSNIIYKNKTYNKKIQHLKKGLMQQLLTGKIRVKV